MSALHPVPAARGWPLWLCLFLLCCHLSAGPDDERIQRLREEVATLETVAEQTKATGEKTRLESKLARMREELSILTERVDIEKRQKALFEAQPTGAVERLGERLRALEVNTEPLDKRLREISAQRVALGAERDALQTKLASLAAGADTTELEETLVNRNEALRSLALQRESVEATLELAREAERLRTFVKDIDVASRPNLRAIFEAYARTRERQKSDDKLGLLATTVSTNLRVASSNRELALQRLAKFDEELALLEKQTGFFRKDAAIEKLLATERVQKRVLAERLPHLTAQVDALRSIETALKQRQELNALEAGAIRDHFVDLRASYLKRLRWPTVALTVLAVLYLVFHYALLPLFYRKEGLLLARRLCRYGMAVAATGVFAGFLFDDLSMVAATLGVVSAALVISLQDVCTSVAGWFVIMTGGKFGIGDRLEIEGAWGDVIDIQLLRTTLIEVNGWMDSDSPTGRVLVIPNNFVFKQKIFNFSHQHPFIWAKIDIVVTFSTPIAEATTLFHKILGEETIEEFAAAQTAADTFRKRYGVDDAVYQPKVNTRIVDSGVELKLLYVSHYRRTTALRNRVSRRIIAELEKNPRIQLAFTTVTHINTTATENAPSAVMGTEPDTGSRPPFGYPSAAFPSRPPVLPGN
ncbi:mechanosensitive ion channel domain-containing protein [Nibricoccus sp. IMCC34717]|uniref:mechanosensitive ion channel domain-containing protein n=1 Tax=Nibricoccus sp. IMCC34717 TaxID=3034021 RepID=UPI00384FD759